MSTKPLALACKLEDLKQLDNKPYIKFQTHLLNRTIDELPRHLVAVLQKLAILQKTDKRHAQGVVMSQTRIGGLIGRSRRTVIRNIQKLKELGWVRVTKNKYCNGLYGNQLCIEVVCPDFIYQDIKSNVMNIVQKPNYNAVHKNNTVYSCVTSMAQDDVIGDTHINNIRNNSSINLTNIREKSLINNFESTFESAELTKLPSVVPHKTSSVEIEPVAIVAETQSENSKPVEFDTFKPQAEIAGFITREERIEVTKKLKAMKKVSEIHPNVQANYQDLSLIHI